MEYIITLRSATRDSEDTLIASEVGIDILLETNTAGRLVFPDDLFQEAKVALISATSAQ